ncbi:hypothetical protein T484DRAFT_1947850 [Baffinella frigidus]|nr:hypothetical protein T484DRAFT_1947850 [Cryptophyta sp. CCMP2293]
MTMEHDSTPAERPGAKLDLPLGSPTRSSYRLRAKHRAQTKFPLPEEPHAGIKHQLGALPQVHEPTIVGLVALFKRGFSSINSPRLPLLPTSLQFTPRDDAVSPAGTPGRTSDTFNRSRFRRDSAMLSPSERFRLRHLVVSASDSHSPIATNPRGLAPAGWDPAPSPRLLVSTAFAPPRLPGQVLSAKANFSRTPHARRAEKRELRTKLLAEEGAAWDGTPLVKGASVEDLGDVQ